MNAEGGGGQGQPEAAEAVRLLRALQPDGPWNLVAIPPDGKPVAKTFAATESEKVVAWVNSYQGKANLYFHPNRLKPGVRNKKAKKSDVEAALMLHVDVDDVDALDKLNRFRPKPSAIIFSGGGFQCFWLLA